MIVLIWVYLGVKKISGKFGLHSALILLYSYRASWGLGVKGN